MARLCDYLDRGAHVIERNHDGSEKKAGGVREIAVFGSRQGHGRFKGRDRVVAKQAHGAAGKWGQAGQVERPVRIKCCAERCEGVVAR